MEKMDRLISLIPFLLLFLLLSPFLILFSQFSLGLHFELEEFFQVLQLSFLQAFLSGIFSVSLGFLGAFGILGHPNKLYREIFLLTPQFIPNLFVIFCFLQLFDHWGGFPFGFWGVVMVHTFMNIGISSVVISRMIESQCSYLIEQSCVMGASFLRTSKILGSYLWKDISYIFLFIFSMCFTSYTIPLILGGSKGRTLEVLIYEAIKISADWNQALFISCVQVFFLFLFSFFFSDQMWSQRTEKINVGIIRKPFLWHFLFAITCVPFLFLLEPIKDIGMLSLLPKPFLYEVLSSAKMSVITGLLVGGGVSALLALACLTFSHHWFQKFLKSYIVPSYVLTGFAFLIFFPNSNEILFLKIILGLVIIYAPFCYRFYFHAFLNRMKEQTDLAKVFGMGEVSIFRSILLPQCKKMILWTSGFAAFWACGDFAFSGILAPRSWSMALQIQDLILNYRLSLAGLFLLILFLIGLGVFSFFIVCSYVISRKHQISSF